MPSKSGIQYYVLVGFGLGIAFSIHLALLYTSTSFAETNLNELLAVPLVVLAMPVVVGLIISIVLLLLATGKEPGKDVPAPLGGKQSLLDAEVGCLGFVMGMLLGPIAALVIYFFAKIPSYGFFSHILFGLFAGGAIGSVIGPLSKIIDQWLS